MEFTTVDLDNGVEAVDSVRTKDSSLVRQFMG
jgi:hypothetical protein